MALRAVRWEHVVEPGDCLTMIAQRYGLSLTELLDANPRFHENPHHIREGWIVYLPHGWRPSNLELVATVTAQIEREGLETACPLNR